MDVKKRRNFLAVLAWSILLVACAPAQGLPKGAEDALVAYWQSLPSYPEVQNHITQAWPSAASAEELTPWAPEMETWCVEAEISAPDPAVDGERLVWLVTRENDSADWKAIMLAAMSASWPYEACGG